MIYLNSHFRGRHQEPLDDAVLKHEAPSIVGYEKVDEIPFDFNRKRLSVAVRHADGDLLITKGEAESVFAICRTVTIDGIPQPFDESRRAQAQETFKKLSADGYRVLGVAVRKVEKQEVYTSRPKRSMTLVGFAAFLDPPKEGDPFRPERAQTERHFRGGHDRRQPVRDAENRPRRRAWTPSAS